MRKTKLLYSLALAPLLLGGYSDNEIGQNIDPLTLTTLPKCADGQFLVYRNGTVNCEVVTGSGDTLPNCETPGQLLTYTSTGELTAFNCTAKGSITLSVTDQQTITNLNTQITQIGTQITAIGTGTRVAARTYRGLTATPSSGALGGLKAATNACVAAYGPGASMCDVYSIYISAAAGKLDLTKDITGAWVYQAEWTNAFGVNSADVIGGLGDNCAGYTSGAAAGGLAGTRFSLVTATGDAANRVPKFYSNTTCDTQLPIACCQ